MVNAVRQERHIKKQYGCTEITQAGIGYILYLPAFYCIGKCTTSGLLNER